MSQVRVGVIGDGQLARMMQRAAIGLGIELRVLTADAGSSAAQVIVERAWGERDDEAAIRALAGASDVLTFEFELLPPEIPERLAAEGFTVRPGPGALLAAQDKLFMRRRLSELGVPCPRWAEAGDEADVAAFLAQSAPDGGGPREAIAKPARGGYDGHGVRVIGGPGDVADWLASGPVLLEEKVGFTRELALMFARRPSGEMALWPVVESRQLGGICAEVIAPAPGLDGECARQLAQIAREIGPALDVTGVCAIEAFELPGPRGDGARVLVNELALRPHNSGHWTIDGSATSQFEQHLRAVLDWPLGPTAMRAPAAAMVNVLGSSYEDLALALPAVYRQDPAVRPELYGKQTRPGRKLGHVNALDEDPATALARARAAAAILRGERA